MTSHGQDTEQPPSRLKSHTLLLKNDTTLIESGTLIESSVELDAAKGGWQFTVDNNQITLSAPENVELDSISLRYRVLYYDLGSSSSLMDPGDLVTKNKIIQIANDYTSEEEESTRLIRSDKLKYTGSFTRGVSAGNNQDVVLESDFNLQMEGSLGSGLSVRAAISDDNIPIQPQGNTQVLQEFDKVFIELRKDSTTVLAGDYELGRPEGYFMNYYKKLKGISASNYSDIGKGWTSYNKGSFAISRGKFRRLELETAEGNQGPYKLLGENNELFLQVLSGTEKVYADGRLLQRGENLDYTIDYNRAELAFTPQVIINDNLRIIVEYEYATQEYLRSLYATETLVTNGRLDLRLNIYNEQDSKTTTGDIVLDSTALSTLENSGDNPAFRSGLFIPDESNFDGITKYRIDGTVLTYAPNISDNDPLAVGASFSNLDNELASYVIDTEAGANGRVYTYVGEGQGEFGPWISITPPEKKQLVTASAAYKVRDSTSVYLETGMSNNDLNRFSGIDNEDNVGFSAFGSFSDIRRVFRKKQAKKKKDSTALKKIWTLSTSGRLEYAARNFKALNPYRPPEFSRDWNLSTLLNKSDEQLYGVDLSLGNGTSTLAYGISGFRSVGQYDGLRNLGRLTHLGKKWRIDLTHNLLSSESTQENTQFYRPKALISRNIGGGISLGAYYEKERNVIRQVDTDSLSQRSFNYDLYKVFITTDEQKNLHVNAAVIRRIDDAVISDRLTHVTTALDYSLGGGWKLSDKSLLDWQFTLRDFENLGLTTERDPSKKSLIGRVNHKLALLKKGLVVDSYLESNSGQEPKLEFQYVEVQRGEGSYVWNDWNEDGIRQINEFDIAPLSDLANFERITIFNNEFIGTNKSVFNSTARVNPKKFLKKERKFWRRWQGRVRHQTDQRLLNEGESSLIGSLRTELLDTSLVSFNSSTDLSVFFDRGSTKRDLQLTRRILSNKLQQITGYEVRSLREYYLRSRINIVRSLDFILEAKIGDKLADSEAFAIQRFDIDFWNLTPQLNFRPSQNLRIVGKYLQEVSTNSIGDMEMALRRTLTSEVTWRQSAQSNLQVSLDLVNITFEGDRNTPVELELLQGLRPGTNYLWSLNFTRRISNNFDLILNYNGRKSEDVRTIHNGGVQLRAIF